MSNIKDILVLNEKAIAVKTPPGQEYFDLFGNEKQQEVRYNVMVTPGRFKSVSIPLPPGSWSIIGMSDKLTEEDWKKVVEFAPDISMYCDYMLIPNFWRFDTATESVQSLLKQKGIEVPHLIVVKNG